VPEGRDKVHPSTNLQNYTRLRDGLILVLVSLIGAVLLVLGSARPVSAQVVYPSWSYTGNLNTARSGHTATLLSNGKVLVAAGGYYDLDNSAELYDQATGTWSSTGNLNKFRAYHTATLLPTGKVLVAGGGFFSSIDSSAELYDPAIGAWSDTGNLNTARPFGYTATLLPNGKVLVAGGQGHNGLTNSAELYDPVTGLWSITGNLSPARADHTATLLPNGKVLVAGGIDANGNTLNAAEVYNPATGTWSSTASLNTGHVGHTATLLPNGKVLVAGFGSAELYDPATGTWSITGNLNTGRNNHTATLLPTGKVLVAGGYGYLSSAELYDPATGTWSITANLNTVRDFGHTATLLLNGKVLVSGGSGDTAELYDPGNSPNANIIDDTHFFVQQHYADFLNRTADSAGLGFWTNEVTSCGADAACLELKRINVSAAFFISIEFQQTGYLVYRIYKASHGNLPGLPVPIKLGEFLPDTQQIGQGVIVNQTGWEQVLENNKQAFTSEFVQRSRFTSAFPTSLTPTQFVDALFANAGVTPAASDRTAAISEFGSATDISNVAARSGALRRVAENSTFTQQEFNKAFVLMQYFGYLRRNPNDPPEPTLDFTGYNFWLDKLDQFHGNFADAEMVKAFINSGEYRQRFGQP
jgi:hypothetical protein